MENISKIAIDDSLASMYFSFNSTTACKTAENTNNDTSMGIDIVDEDDCDQNNTLEAGVQQVDDSNEPVEQIQTIKKLSIGTSGISPPKSIAKNILKAYKALSSTPTKAQLMRSVDVNRGSAPVTVDVCDLGVAFLDAPQESINSIVLSEDKENQPQESQEIYSETSSEIVVSVIEKTHVDEEKPIKKVGFSNLPILKNSGNFNIRGGTPKVPRRSMPRCEPDLTKNRPSRIIPSKKIPTLTTKSSDVNPDEIPKMLNSILKISKGLPSHRKSLGGNQENPFNLLGKATRMSIVKTTLNSPARKVSRKSMVASVQVGKNLRHSILPHQKGPSATARRSVMPLGNRKSLLPTNVSPKKRSLLTTSRKSMIPAIASSSSSSTSSNITSRKSVAALKVSTSAGEPNKKTALMKPPSNLKEDLICTVCSRKFLVLSLFESHKKSHIIPSTSTSSASSNKQIFSAGNDNKCRYCDKKFAISKALYNHLIEKCPKIPPGDKKKLLFPSIPKPTTTSTQSILPPKSMSDFSSCDSLSSNNTQSSRNQPSSVKKNTVETTAPSSSSKLKKKLAHSGVYCTPNKQIVCHVCKANFNNILAFTEHKLTHSNSNTPQSEDEHVASNGDSASGHSNIDTNKSDKNVAENRK